VKINKIETDKDNNLSAAIGELCKEK